MNMKSIQLLVTLLLFCCSLSCQAALSCTIPVSSGFSTAYAPTGVTPNVTQGTVTFNCTRTKGSDPTSVILRANNGLNAAGSNNRANAGTTEFISYEAYKDSACNTMWSSNSTATAITVTLLGDTGPQSLSASFWGCITLANQVATANTTYTDKVTVSIRSGNKTLNSSSFNVSIFAPASCSISTMPGNVAFNYTAFSASAVIASSTFGVNCNNKLPYTMSLDTSSGVVSGLNYALQINSLTSPESKRGTAAEQTHTINGTMPAGQAGTCSTALCIGSQVHTLTITY